LRSGVNSQGEKLSQADAVATQIEVERAKGELATVESPQAEAQAGEAPLPKVSAAAPAKTLTASSSPPLVRVVGKDFSDTFLHGTAKKNIPSLAEEARPTSSIKPATSTPLLPRELNEFGAEMLLSEPRQAHQAVIFASGPKEGMAVIKLREGTKILDLSDEAARAPHWSMGGGSEDIRFFERPAITNDFLDWKKSKISDGYKERHPNWQDIVTREGDPASPQFNKNSWTENLVQYAKDRGYGAIRFADETLLTDRGVISEARAAKPSEVEAAKTARAFPGGKTSTLFTDKPTGARAEAESFTASPPPTPKPAEAAPLPKVSAAELDRMAKQEVDQGQTKREEIKTPANMTPHEYMMTLSPSNQASFGRFHRQEVQAAISRGEPVLASNLKEYGLSQPEEALPGMRPAIEEQKAAAQRQVGENLTNAVRNPAVISISGTTGDIERTSPLFAGNEEVQGQKQMFAPKPEAPKVAAGEAKVAPETGTLGPVHNVNPKELVLEPQTFQFKTELTQAERAEKLRAEAPYSKKLAEGPVTYWRDPADGKLKVVDGHYRTGKAQRGETKAEEFEAREVFAPDVKAARAFGAYRNIASGQAKSVDVAKFMRDTGVGPEHFADEGIPVTAKLIADGQLLANLDDSIFDQVATGKLPEKTGIAIGQLTDKTAQQGMLALLKRQQAKGGGLSYNEINALARRAAQAGTTDTTAGLFGPESESNAVEAARMESYVRDRLSSDKRMFGYVSKGERPTELARGGNVINAEESKAIAEKATTGLGVFDRLISFEGPINDAINEGAAAVKRGESRQAAGNRAYSAVQEAVTKELKGARQAE
jgi:hypothetical protein